MFAHICQLSHQHHNLSLFHFCFSTGNLFNQLVQFAIHILLAVLPSKTRNCLILHNLSPRDLDLDKFFKQIIPKLPPPKSCSSPIYLDAPQQTSSCHRLSDIRLSSYGDSQTSISPILSLCKASCHYNFRRYTLWSNNASDSPLSY